VSASDGRACRWRPALAALLVAAFGAASSDCKTSPTAEEPAVNAGADTAPSADFAQSTTVDVLTFQYDLSRSGVTSAETILTPANVTAGSFGKLATLPVDGNVYAQPLYVSKLVTATGVRDVVFVATQHDSVYAFDAATSELLWHDALLETGETPVPSADTLAPDISPEIGITGTPVIDRTAELLYVVTKAKRADKTYVQRLHALHLADGTEGAGAPVVIAAQLRGTSSDAKDGLLSFEPLRHNQRAALALIGGKVVIAWASHGDNEPYHGWLMAYDTADLARPPAAFLTSPDGLGGGIWMGASGPTADADGNIYVASGNGPVDEDDDTRTNFGLSALRMRLDGGAFTVQDFFSPHETSDLNAGDLDFGTSAPILLPDRATAPIRRLVVAGKTGWLYVLDRDDLGGYDSETDHVVQMLQTGSAFLISNPVFFDNRLYVLPHQAPLMAFEIDPATGLFYDGPSFVADTCMTCFDRGSTPSISAEGTKNAILWVLDNGGYKTGAPAILHAYDATDITRQLYVTAPILLESDSAAPAVKFTVPAVANGRVFVGGQKAVTVYGLLAP
jgi:outer membrane protein assembly factor BamB